jgi:ATP-binding cassette, subfamily B, bacterial MsbA
MKFWNWSPPAGSAVEIVVRLVSEQGRLYWKRYLAAFGMMFVVAASTSASAYLIGSVINAAYVARNFPSILLLSGITVVLFTLKGFANYGQAVTLSEISNSILANQQKLLFSKLMDENLGYLTSRHSSEFMARLVAGAGSIAAILNLLITSIGRDFLSLIGLVGVMVYQDWFISMLSLLIAPAAIFGVRKLISRVRDLTHMQYVTNATIMETLQESLQGIRTVKAFSLENVMRGRVAESASNLEKHANSVARVSNRATPLMETLGGFAVAISLVYGGYGVVMKGATPGQFFSFLTAFLLAYEPAKRLTRVGIELNANVVGAKMLLEIVDRTASEPDDAGKPDLELREKRVEIDKIDFSYRPGETVLDNLSLIAEPGKFTALVGPSGGGKSTVMALLLRLYEPQHGAIIIDGQRLCDCNRQSVRQQMAYVGQDVFLFKSSVRDNIALGKKGASEAEIIAAAKAAYAHEFIESLPQKYDSPVGEHGTLLSGGQRQRVAIARALIKDAPIILLDEATASLDSESESYVQSAIARLCEGRTTIAIAHRLHTIQHADRICVIEEGKVVESGRHDDLLAANGRYASFFRLQRRENMLV